MTESGTYLASMVASFVPPRSPRQLMMALPKAERSKDDQGDRNRGR